MDYLRKLFFNWRYLGNPPWDTGISPPELIDFLENTPPGKALDLGCGTGTNVLTLVEYNWHVIGVDFAPRAIRAAKHKTSAYRGQVKLYVDDVTELTHINENFDLILDIGCLHSVPESKRKKYIANVQRLLAPGGTFLLYAFTKDSIDDTGSGVTTEELASLLKDLKLIKHEPGTERGWRTSAWYTFSKIA